MRENCHAFFIGVLFLVIILLCPSFAEADGISGDKPAPPTRQISLSIAVDKSYVDGNAEWRDDVIKVVKQASGNFEKLPQPIAFYILEIVVLEFVPTDKMDDLLSELRTSSKNFKKTAQIVVGITARDTVCNDLAGRASEMCVGLAEEMGDHLFITKSKGNGFPDSVKISTLREQAELLTHELGHIFGALDISSEKQADSFMTDTIPATADRFDDMNIGIIMKNRNRPFHQELRSRANFGRGFFYPSPLGVPTS